MELYLIRHAEAQPLGEDDIQNDEARPLTQVGRAQCQALAEALQRVGLRPGRMLTSPLLRAKQTAEAVLHHWAAPVPHLEECDLLAPGFKHRKLMKYLGDLNEDSVALVGHMPDLAELAAWLIGSKKAQLDLDKAGAACVRCASGLGKGDGLLTWLVTPEWCRNS
jgi:phosphohistidine phosphatase